MEDKKQYWIDRMHLNVDSAMKQADLTLTGVITYAKHINLDTKGMREALLELNANFDKLQLQIDKAKFID